MRVEPPRGAPEPGPEPGATGGLGAGVVIVVPAFNEAATIGAVVSELVATGARVAVVDDGSTDATAEAARRAGARVLSHLVNRGQGAALQTGLAWALVAGARAVVTFDADGQHRAADLPRLLAPLERGEAEIVLGSRFLGGAAAVPPLRRTLLRAAVVFTRLTSGMRVTDAHNGLRALSREAARRISLKLDRMAHASEILDQVRDSGLAWTEVPVQLRYTAYSRAKGQSGWAALKVAADYLLGRLLD